MAEQSKPTAADRRTVLRATALGVAAAGVGVTAAACSSNNSVAQGSNATTAQPADSAGAGSTGAASAGPIATTAQVPVGGGFINQDAKIVVTQPTAGEYKAFTAVCTHAQCLVGSVTNNVILCPCHGSEYSAKDGSVLRGPAPQALAAETVKVSGSNIVVES